MASKAQLQINCFGHPQILLDGAVVEGFRSSKAKGLLLYLAATGRAHSRASLVGLLWGDLTEENGAANLRKTLTNLRKLVEPFLAVSRDSIGLDWGEPIQVDVQNFEQNDAIDLVQGDFLEGFYIRGCAEFEAWTLTERYRLKEKYLQLLRANIDESQAAGRLPQAIEQALTLVAHDPLHEAGQRTLMRLYALNNQRSKAAEQYAQLVQLLDDELGVPPEEVTQSLHQAILNDELSGLAEPIPALPTADSATRQQLALLGEKVAHYWLDTVLAGLEQLAPPAEIGWQLDPDAIAHPWPELRPKMAGKRPSLLAEYESADRALLILGEPGSGKTISLLSLTRQLLSKFVQAESPQIPVVLLLSSWVKKQTPLAVWVIDQLNSRYQIPQRLASQWLVENQLTLMLDGLDEVEPALQSDCLRAINDFRQAYGLAGIAVSCRTGTLRSLADQRPQMSGAITLQPLTPQAINGYLAQRGVAPAEPDLLDLAQSPLMLQVIAQTAAVSPADASPSALFTAFVDQSLQNSSDKPAVKTLLSWLAGQMAARSQTIFYIEDLQPGWLAQRRSRLIYLLLTRILIGGLLGIGIALLYFAGTLNQPEFKFQMFLKFGEVLPVPAASRDLWAFMLIIQAHGVFAALWHFFLFERWRSQPNPSRKKLWLIGGQVLFSLSYVVGLALPFDPLGPAFFSAILFVYFLILGYGMWGYAHDYESDIRPSSALSWSWRGAAVGAAFGLFLVATFFAVGADPIYLPMAFAAAVVTGGLRRNRLETTVRPNQGMWLTARNSLLGGLIQAVLPAVFIGWQAPLGLTLLISGASALLGWMVFGGAILIKHGAVRWLLHREVALPWQLAQTLGRVCRLSLLQQIGSGYLFFHQKLLTYFANLEK